MIRKLLIMTVLIGVLTPVSLLAQVDVEITQNFPESVKAGEEFTVEIAVRKGGIAGIGKLQQVLPEGFQATAGETKGAVFSHKNDIAKFIWMSIPSGEEFTVSYTVSVDPSVSGTKTISGTFAYVENEERKKARIDERSITVEEGEAIASGSDEPEVSDEGETSASASETTADTEEAATETSEVTDKEEKEDRPVTVYKDEKTAGESKAETYEAEEVEEVKDDNEPETTAGTTEDKEAGSETTEKTESSSASASGKSSTKSTGSKSTSSSSSTTSASSGIVYRVQIAATQNRVHPKFIESLSGTYGIYEDPHIQKINGWNKCFIGEFGSYSEADDYKRSIRGKGLRDAFVVAFQSGNVISLSKARKME